MSDGKEPMCYIGTKPECGCIIGSILVGSVPAKLLGKQVAAWIEEGYNAEFVTHSYVTENWGVCDHRVKQLPLKEQPLAPPPSEEKPALTYDVEIDGTVQDLQIKTMNGTGPHNEQPAEEHGFPDYETVAETEEAVAPPFNDLTDYDDIVMAELDSTEQG